MNEVDVGSSGKLYTAVPRQEPYRDMYDIFCNTLVENFG
jgi:hypothetical protein